ncbi:TetR/AcrR family transcriptional regulator [Microlunatus sp. GCM10028923]|uniref:TetR/AcrR family transcriptional regulator n=1 Tax=Microlunatus sp. GCM10028923 TaxID=3273400 RepID=UPI00361419BE
MFAEQGYQQTTVAQIAAEADVAKKTFFNHFPTKEDVLFADAGRFVEAAHEVIAAREPGEPIGDVLLKVYDHVLAQPPTDELRVPDTAVLDIAALARNVPAVQAKALQVMSELQQQVATAFAEAFPDELDPVTAGAAVGALIGAGQGASMASLRLGHSLPEHLAGTRRALDLVRDGLRTL